MSLFEKPWMDDLFCHFFNCPNEVFDGFEFRKSGVNWISGSRLRLNGEEGNKSGKVYIYQNSPFFIQDYATGGKAVTTYIQELGLANSWTESIRYLARKVGFELPFHKLTEEEIERAKELDLKARLFEVANDFFIDNLSNQESSIAKSQKAEEMRTYLKGRGYSSKILRKHFEDFEARSNKMEVGFIPSQDDLCDHLKSNGFTLDVIESLFLKPFIEGELKALSRSIGYTHQLTIPWRDLVGRIRGFAFRNINWTRGDKIPKYLYSLGMQRSDLLFNLKAVRGDKDLVVVEGLLDALHARALGMENVVALGGASLNADQIKLAKRYGAEKFTLCLDQDEPGRVATERAIQALKKTDEDIEIYIASLPTGFKDPDELIKNKTIEAFREVIGNAQREYLHLLHKRFDHADSLKSETNEISDKDRDSLLRDVVQLGAYAKTPIEKDYFSQVFIERGSYLGVSEKSLNQTIEVLQLEKEEQKRKKEFQRILDKAHELSETGKVEEARVLLGKHDKQLNTRPLETSYLALTTPLTEQEIRAKFKAKLDRLDSGFKFEENPLYLPSGAMTIFAGPTGHGKTTFLRNIALNVALDVTKRPVHFFSYEESLEEIFIKFLNTFIHRHLKGPISNECKYAIETYYRKDSLEFIKEDFRDEFLRLKDIFYNELICTGKLHIHYMQDPSVEELTSQVELLRRHDKVSLVCLDYIQLLSHEGYRSSLRKLELSEICNVLMRSANNTGLPFLIGAQFNRTVVSKDQLHTSNVADASDIEKNCNLFIGGWNNRYPELKNGTKTDPSKGFYATILKGRDRETGASETFSFDGNKGIITSNSSHLVSLRSDKTSLGRKSF